MASHIQGQLYYERMGRTGPVMVFIHPNPLDQSCWMYQMSHFSSWYRCVAVDVPGYGRSPRADEGLSLADIAEATWEVVDEIAPGESAVLVGCSVGSQIAPWMYHLQPGRTLALVLTGTGFRSGDDPVANDRRDMRIRNYRELGVAYRWRYTFEDFSPAFRSSHLAHYFADLFTERDDHADVDSIIRQFEAPRVDEGLYGSIRCPTLILTGSEDNAHRAALVLNEKISGSRLRVLPGAGHACQLEQPWLFDRLMLEFLDDNRLWEATR
jgi:pimeloyl-ACP methyl ester carboxylesterase